jgi:uncharacterized membrane protein YdjX (TVP38/TMEM64 family)
MPIIKRDVISFIVLVVVIATAWFVVENMDLREGITALSRGQVSKVGVSTPLVFILSYIALIVSLVPSAPLNVAAGILFGPLLGTMLSWISVMVGGSICFFLAKRFGESFVRRVVKEKSEKLNHYNTVIENDGFELILLFRIIPFFPIAGFNYMFGLTKMKFKTYFWGSALGTIPGIFILTYFGNTLANFSWYKVAISAGLILTMIVVSWMYKKREKEKISTASPDLKEEAL